MTINKRKKVSRLRGNTTHGWGSMKKNRGSGNRGGKGNAGSGKRSDSKKPSIWSGKYFGKHGFTSKNTKCIKATNINYLEENLLKLTKDSANKENGFYSIDLKKLGFDKLLSKGKVTNKYKVKVQFASKKAVEKLKAGGGEVILNQK
jgi:large subunit ribosomal protein L15